MPQGTRALRNVSTPIRGSIDASLLDVDPACGSALAAQVARLVSWRGDVVRNIHPRDHLDLVFETDPEPQLVALCYRGAEINLRAVRCIDERGIARYYDDNNLRIEPQLRRAPVMSYVQITEVVQHSRGKRRHEGIDLKAPVGTPVLLPYDARIVRTNWNRRINGNCIEAQYTTDELPSPIIARFLHLDEIAADVHPEARFPAGVFIGTVGSTGRSSAAHLHYELHDASGRVLDPLHVHGTIVARAAEHQHRALEGLRRTYFDVVTAKR